MASDIAGSVTATYDAVITAPDDGDATNSAGLVTMMLGGLNRTEFLHARAVSAPWVISDIFEDFLNVSDAVSGLLLCDRIWQLNSSVEHGYGNAGHQEPTIGTLQIFNLSGNVGRNEIATAQSYVLGQVRSMTVRVSVDAILAGQHLDFSFTNINGSTVPDPPGGTHVAMTCFDSTNWELRTGISSVAIPGSTMVAGTFMQLQLTHDGAGLWTATADNGTPATAVATIPSIASEAKLAMKFETPNAGVRVIEVDFVHASCIPTGRVL